MFYLLKNEWQVMTVKTVLNTVTKGVEEDKSYPYGLKEQASESN